MGSRILYSFRNIKRNKLNAIITTAGLSIALACVIIIYLFVQQEKSFNSFHKNAENIYRLNYILQLKNGTKRSTHLVKPDLAEILKNKVPQIDHCTPYRVGYMAQLDLADENMEIELGIAEQDFFDMFSFELLHGNKDKLLVDPTNIVITRSLAKKLLERGSNNMEDLIGQSLRFTFIKDTEFTIVGILEDISKNSTIYFEAIIPFKYENKFWQLNNDFGNSTIFFELKKDMDSDQTNILISDVVKDLSQKSDESWFRQRLAELEGSDQKPS